MTKVAAQLPAAAGPGRAGQRRRTRKAIVQAAAQLLTAGADPSIGEIAAAADVSRRTVYTYFPTLDQLLLDAAIESMGLGIDNALDAVADADVRVRVAEMISVLAGELAQTLPLGRKLIRLTVDAPPGGPGPKRGYRRTGWIEKAVEPLRLVLGHRRFEKLVSSLSLVVGWEAFIVLFDVRGLSQDEARTVITDAALALVDGALAEIAPG